MGLYSNIIINAKMKQLNTVDKLSNWMDKNMKYAFVTVDKKISDDFDHMYPDYRLQSPIESFISKVGVCWDQAIFEKYMFNNIIHKKCKMYYIIQHDKECESTHTFIIYEDKNKKYYFENSFEKIRGVYEVNNLEDTFDFIIDKMRETKKDNNTEVFEINKSIESFTNNFTEKTDIVSFMNFCQSCKLVYKRH